MHFPKLSPLQSRFAATFVASLALILIYLAFSHPQFAYAADSIAPEDHNHRRLFEDGERRLEETLLDGLSATLYEPDFLGADRGIIGRAPADITAVANNAPQREVLSIGSTSNWVFPKESLAGPLSPPTPGLPEALWPVSGDNQVDGIPDESTRKGKRQGQETTPRNLYITLNTCSQPTANGTNSGDPPQLQLYLSQTPRNPKPGPDKPSEQQQVFDAEGGYMSRTIQGARGDIFISVSAPNASNFNGTYSYELTASIDAPYHALNDSNPNLFLIDSDTTAGLFVTDSLTYASTNSTNYFQWLNTTPPYTLVAYYTNNTALRGLQNSVCALTTSGQLVGSLDNNGSTNRVLRSMTTRGLDNIRVKEQLYVTGLNGSSSYFAQLVQLGNSTAEGGGVVGGGGKVWKPMTFETKSDNNCAVIFDLTFCKDVAYSVPSNPSTFPNSSALARFYDSHAQKYYQNFSNSLAQIPCEASSSAQYSLVRDCNDCDRSYRDWLCAVTIPRCADYSSTLPYLVPRNVAQAFPNGSLLPPPSTPSQQEALHNSFGNASRVPLIDAEVKPGPYKELLPCKDLCYELVRSCPAALQFACPLPGKGLERSYGSLDLRTSENLTCNFPGAAVSFLQGRLNGAPGLRSGAAGWAWGFVPMGVAAMTWAFSAI